MRKRVIKKNQHDIYNKEYNQAYDIIEHSRYLVINLAKKYHKNQVYDVQVMTLLVVKDPLRLISLF